MKIRIKTNDYRGFEEFPIVSIKYQLDEKGIPVDIAIGATEDVLEHISEFAQIGYNIRHLIVDGFLTGDVELIIKGASHEALYARLNHFNVVEASKVIYK